MCRVGLLASSQCHRIECPQVRGWQNALKEKHFTQCIVECIENREFRATVQSQESRGDGASYRSSLAISHCTEQHFASMCARVYTQRNHSDSKDAEAILETTDPTLDNFNRCQALTEADDGLDTL
jgi:hypothetical protein